MAEPSARSTTELVAETIDDTLLLIRKELELARIGIVEGLSSRLKAAGVIALALIVILPGLLFILLGTALWLPFSTQVNLLVFGLLLTVVSGIGIAWGVHRLKRGDKDSNEAMDQVKEDARWVRQRLTR